MKTQILAPSLLSADFADLGGEIKKIERFILPDSDITRSMVMIRKVENTPKKYPRKAGTPGKHPIK